MSPKDPNLVHQADLQKVDTSDASTAAPDPLLVWRPIETAPMARGQLVDILLKSGVRYAGCHWDTICEEYRHITACGVLVRLKDAAYWMPLPPPPSHPQESGSKK